MGAHRLLWLSMALLAGTACSAWHATEPGDELEVRAVPLPFNPQDATDRGGAALRVVGIHQLTANRPEFGGFSGMVLDGQELTAVSDRGYWWRSRLELDADHHVVGLRESRIGAMYDLDSRPLRTQEKRDAEEIAHWPGGFLVSFEGAHRVMFYRRRPATAAAWRALTDRRPARLVLPSDLMLSEPNGGFEAMTRLDDGRLLLISEKRTNAEGQHMGWLAAPSARRWQQIALEATEDFDPTSATTLPNGDVLLLQRSYRSEVGARARFCLLQADTLAPLPTRRSVIAPRELLRIAAPQTVDNFESVDVLLMKDGRLFVFVLSDDNYSANQRTLLLQLELIGGSQARG